LSLESLIQLPLKLFGVHPPSIWKQTTNDVVSLPQMQSSGERTIGAPMETARPRDELSRPCDGGEFAIVSDAIYATRRIREFET
jgi:hypothetical protein